MSLLKTFLRYHLAGANKGEIISKSIVTYTHSDKIFVIGYGNAGGVITEEIKGRLFDKFNDASTKVYFFSLFFNNEEFHRYCDTIAWGTYAWLLTAPDHTIQFDNHPKVNVRY